MGGQPTNVADFLLDGKDPEKTALQFLRRQFTYGELCHSADQVGRFLVSGGAKKGQRAALVGGNSFSWVASYVGILKAGLVCVPLSGGISGRELNEVLRMADAHILFAEATFAAREMIDSNQVRIFNVEEIAAAVARPGRFPAVESDDLAALMFTSGSTGRPRGVMVSHGNIVANTESIIEYLHLTAADRIMTVLPFYYCFGTSLLHTHLRVGGTLVVDARFAYPEIVLQRMIETECTGFAGVPSHFQLLLRQSNLREKRFPRLRYVQQAGGHMAPAVVNELCEALPTTEVYVMYGQTEATARLSYLPPEYLPAKLGSIGRGMPGVSLRVINEAGEDVGPGEIGEIVARGRNVTRGYWGEPDESARTFRNGVLYTGDLATVDQDGFIYIVDRAKDFMKCGGQRVSCRHLEEELLAYEEVSEAAVIGIPDPVLGESPKAFVVPRYRTQNGFEERLRGFCRHRMPHQLVPQQVVVLNALPKNEYGKVLKNRLKS